MNDHPHEPDESLPPELVDALRSLDGPAVAPSAAHDAALLAGAREHLSGIGINQVERRGRSRHVLAFIGAGGAVAAAAAVTFAVVISQNESPDAAAPAVAQSDAFESSQDNDSRRPTDAGLADQTGPHTETPLPGGDLDASGTVDILDAFALARSIEANTADATLDKHDFNGDGRVDTQDADWLAQRAVRVRRDGGRG